MAKEKESSFTPMVEQYLSFKKQYGEIILFFRIGDFYEMFLSDAEIVSRELQLFLTKKASGNGTFIPMCGIPHHAYLQYAQKLVDKGYKVAIVEQVEDPKLTKKLVKRDVIQIITPGANLDLTTEENNYTASIYLDERQVFLAYGDITTGEMRVLSLENNYSKIVEKLLSLDIKELILSKNTDQNLISYIKSNMDICISFYEDTTTSIEDEYLFENLKDGRQIEAIARVYNYLKNMERRDLSYFKPAINLNEKKNMKLDYSAISNMELVKSLDGKSFGTLYWLLNKTKTPMGARYLKTQICSPVANLEEVNKRLNLTQCFVNNYLVRETLRKDLESVFDMERLIARMGYENCNGHDLLQLKKSLQILPLLKEHLSTLVEIEVKEIQSKLGDYKDLVSILEKAISEDCPLTITEGEIFKKGYNPELDELITLTTDAKAWIAQLEIKERERTGINKLKVGYTTVFGYYIEVSKSFVDQIKPEFGYIRKQTLTTGERYVTSELQEKEARILRAKDDRAQMEYKLFKELRKYVSTFTTQIQKTSDAISELDYFLNLAFVSSENNYIRPEFNENRSINITDARHPIIEKAAPEKVFVANDYKMDEDTNILIITGPNMGGKSTYMKEFGLLVVMAQIGCFVPASHCSIPLFDSLYTRIGASDNLIKGQSTFMTEMSEVAQALSNATNQSLFLFDEIGRGTATFDGMAIAQSIIEYIVKNIQAKTFFSTHYHEITRLSEQIHGVKNIHCEVNEDDDQVTFLYKMSEGSMDKSYGVNVAKLAGLPLDIVERADELLTSLEAQSTIDKSQIKKIVKEDKKVDPIIEELKKLDPMTLSPLEALNYLIDIKKRIK